MNALERDRAVGFKPYLCIRKYEGQSDADAVAIYEAEHGPIDTESENLLYVIVV